MQNNQEYPFEKDTRYKVSKFEQEEFAKYWRKGGREELKKPIKFFDYSKRKGEIDAQRNVLFDSSVVCHCSHLLD